MVRNLAALLLLVCWLGGGSTRKHSFAPHPRIVGGVNCSIQDFPFQVSLRKKDLGKFKHYCGATIIHEFWALTAAEYVNDWNKEPLFVRSGTASFEAEGNVHHISEIITHPEYNPTNHEYDAALIRVIEPFVFSDVVQPIRMAETTPGAGTPASLSGWGGMRYYEEESLYPSILQCINYTIYDHDVCEQIYKNKTIKATIDKLCAVAPEGKTARFGDRGGGLVTMDKQYLVGILLQRSENPIKDYPEQFTDVARIRNWVNNTIRSTQPVPCNQYNMIINVITE